MFYLISLCFFCLTTGLAAQLSVSVKAEAAILINAETGAVLYEKNARKLHYPASITKVATALYALQIKGDQLEAVVTGDQEALGMTTPEAKLRSNFTLPPYWLESDGKQMGIKRGEQWRLLDLLYAMMVASANDPANMIAQFAGGTIPNFMEGMNVYLKEIGCKHTRFYNPHGLHYPQHQTTAQDMATIAREAMKNPLFRKIVATVRYRCPKTNMREPYTFVQTNMLLRSGKFYYPQAIGVKTGYHARAGHTFVGAAQKDDRQLIVVLLKEKKRPDLFLDAIKIFDTAFQQSKVTRLLLRAGPRPQTLSLKGAIKPVSTYLKEDLAISYYPAEEPKVKSLLFWDAVQLPIAKDQRVGEIKVKTEEGRWIASVPLYAQEEVKATWDFTLKQFIRQGWDNHPVLTILSGLIVLFSLVWFYRGNYSGR